MKESETQRIVISSFFHYTTFRFVLFFETAVVPFHSRFSLVRREPPVALDLREEGQVELLGRRPTDLAQVRFC